MNEPKLSEEGERLIDELWNAGVDQGECLHLDCKIPYSRGNTAKAALRARMAYLESRVAELEAARAWRPIETFHKLDNVIGWSKECGRDTASYQHGKWCWDNSRMTGAGRPTHGILMPQPPCAQAESK